MGSVLWATLGLESRLEESGIGGGLGIGGGVVTVRDNSFSSAGVPGTYVPWLYFTGLDSPDFSCV